MRTDTYIVVGGEPKISRIGGFSLWGEGGVNVSQDLRDTIPFGMGKSCYKVSVCDTQGVSIYEYACGSNKAM